MVIFQSGQRWTSETEPELGLGILESASRHQVCLHFPASGETRTYAAGNAPIQRVRFHVGDSVQSQEGALILIEAVHEEAGLLTYAGSGLEISEAELADTVSFSKPEDRLIHGRVDASGAYALRYEANACLGAARKSSVTGFVGGRIDLIPHQLYIAAEVASRHLPRVLLADEVGLGKTIEAGLILHRLHMTGRANRILILLPEALIHQWLVEMLRRFNLFFALFETERYQLIEAEEGAANPFLENQLVICSIEVLVEHEGWAAWADDVKWDMLVVDEAHHLQWSPDAVSPEYKRVEMLARQSHGLLLLTATPEQMGVEGHFARLRLLDPERYYDLERFKKEQSNYAQVAVMADKLTSGCPLTDGETSYLHRVFPGLTEAAFKERLKNRSMLLDELVDRQGTGRVVFRNRREGLKGFPRRKALPVRLDLGRIISEEMMQERLLQEFDLEVNPDRTEQEWDYRHGPRIKWLADLLHKLGREKILLICRTKEKVMAIHQALDEELNVKMAVFHEALTLIQRDRNAAWFADPEGARILLCSEIGSEGRNFQFAHHLVLFDLPLNPELLEQRIGRLDRIGQIETIRIHIPYLSYSWTELLTRWHHEGLGNIEHSLRGGNAYLERFGDEIHCLGHHCHEKDPRLREQADALIEESCHYREDLEARLSRGKDALIALNSFRETEALELVNRIREEDTDRRLDGFMDRIFDHFGVEVEEIEERSFRLTAGRLFIDSFPRLPETGVTVTYDRMKALEREDIDFLTWDHPMVRGAVDLMLGSEQGNSALTVWSDPDMPAPPILIEAIYLLESVAPPPLHIDRFLPSVPLRILVNAEGEDCSDRFSHALINARARDEEAFRIRENPNLLQSLIPRMLEAARAQARIRRASLLETAVQKAHARLDGEAVRLKALQKVNPNVSQKEVELAESMVKNVIGHIAKARLRLDAVRLILKNA